MADQQALPAEMTGKVIESRPVAMGGNNGNTVPIPKMSDMGNLGANMTAMAGVMSGLSFLAVADGIGKMAKAADHEADIAVSAALSAATLGLASGIAAIGASVAGAAAPAQAPSAVSKSPESPSK